MMKMISKMNPDEVFDLSIKRKDDTFTAKVQIGTRPASYGINIELPKVKKIENELEQALDRFPASPVNLLLLQKRIDQYLRGKFGPKNCYFYSVIICFKISLRSR